MDFDAEGGHAEGGRPIPGPPPGRAPGAGDEAIDEAVAGTEDLDGLPVAEHVARFDEVHVSLTAALASIDKV